MRSAASGNMRGVIEVRRCFDISSGKFVDREYLVDGHLSTPVQKTLDVTEAKLWLESLVTDFLRLPKYRASWFREPRRGRTWRGFAPSPDHEILGEPLLALELIRDELAERSNKAAESLGDPIPWGFSAAMFSRAKGLIH